MASTVKQLMIEALSQAVRLGNTKTLPVPTKITLLKLSESLGHLLLKPPKEIKEKIKPVAVPEPMNEDERKRLGL